jgi:hypothetical protein
MDIMTHNAVLEMVKGIKKHIVQNPQQTYGN